MTADSFFAFACGGLIALMFGTLLTFAGYRMFLFLLPIWGFFFGLSLGAHSIQAIFPDTSFLGTITSWVVGFIVALVFALLSYLFYAFAVALVAGALGYTVAVGFLTWIGLSFGLLVWLIGLAVGVILVIVTFRFNLQKWVIIIATAILGASTILATFLLLFKHPATEIVNNPIKLALSTSPLLAVLFGFVAVLGIIIQVRQNRRFEIEVYNRWA